MFHKRLQEDASPNGGSVAKKARHTNRVSSASSATSRLSPAAQKRAFAAGQESQSKRARSHQEITGGSVFDTSHFPPRFPVVTSSPSSDCLFSGLASNARPITTEVVPNVQPQACQPVGSDQTSAELTANVLPPPMPSVQPPPRYERSLCRLFVQDLLVSKLFND